MDYKEGNEIEGCFFSVYRIFAGLFFTIAGIAVFSSASSLIGIICFIVAIIIWFPQIIGFIRKKLKIIPLHFTPVSLCFWILPLFAFIPMIICIIEDFFDIRILRTWNDITSVNGHAYSNANAGDVIGSIFILLFCFLIYGILFYIGYFIMEKQKEKCEKYYKYVEDNKVSLGLFARPYSSMSNIVLANKYVVIEFNILSFVQKRYGKIEIKDKIKNLEYNAEVLNKYKVFEKLCGIFNYDTTAQNLIKAFSNHKNILKQPLYKPLYLDINQASEAELTALPGVTIAKAKRAIKMRKKYAFYLSVNQFYEAINLEEQFIEQITSNGTKILLNNLPEYKALEMKQEE